jgi:hypothetical protein
MTCVITAKLLLIRIMKNDLFLNFLTFLLAYNSCTGDFVVTLPFMCTMYPGLVHPLQEGEKEENWSIVVELLTFREQNIF